ncbi:hypothetical protein ACP4OV_015244 [Aristida adscensionis]
MASAAGNGNGNGNSSVRNSCSPANLLVWVLNLSLLALAAAALAPVLLLRPRPTPFGWALLSVHAATLLSALAALRAHLTHRLCAATHAALAVAALAGQGLAAAAFFLRYGHSLRLLGSARDRREQFALAFLEEVLLLAMFLAQAVALAATCVVGRRWAREHEAVETEKAAVARKRGRKMARVQAEAAAAAEPGVRAVDEKVMRSSSGKKVHWATNEGFEEC